MTPERLIDETKGWTTIGERNCPKNIKVVSIPMFFPLISALVNCITHRFRLGSINPNPKPAINKKAVTNI